MKKILFFIVATFLLGISCEKDEMKLSEYVIGEWQSQEIDLGGTLAVFSVDIKTGGKYVLGLTADETTVICPETGYVVNDDANKIVIDQPDFPFDDEPPTGTQTFTVTWMEDSETMTWLPDNSGGGDAPTIVWTRHDN
jgi:hypothetical protein